MDKKPTIALWEHPWPMVLLPWPSGVICTVQCGGLACYQRAIEGLVVPLSEVYGKLVAEQLGSYHLGCSGRPLSTEEADTLDAILACDPPQSGRPKHPQLLLVQRDRLAESTEAWVPVSIWPENDDPTLGDFGGREGILVWQNCD